MSRRESPGYESWTITVKSDGMYWLATRLQPGIPHVCAKAESRAGALKALADELARPVVLDPNDPLAALCRPVAWPESWPREVALRDEVEHYGMEVGSGHTGGPTQP